MEYSNYGPDEPQGQHPGDEIEQRANEAAPALPRWDTGKAVDFLCTLVPAGRLALAEIDPDAPGCRGETFALPAKRQQLAAWIEARQGRQNLYYTLNEPAPRDRQRGAHGRLSAADVETIRGVVVDLDPRRDVELAPCPISPATLCSSSRASVSLRRCPPTTASSSPWKP